MKRYGHSTHFTHYLIAVILLLWGLGASAQTFRGSLSGSLVDPSGAVVSGASVKATNQSTGLSYDAKSSSAGRFVFADLPLGPYKVTAEAPGFQSASERGINIGAGVVRDVSLLLKVASSTQTVEVSAEADTIALDTASSVRTDVLSDIALHELPRHGGDFLETLSLLPGYAGQPNQGQGAINGGRGSSTNYQIDGTDNNDPWHNMAGSNEGGIAPISGALLPLDAVQEFTYQANGEAETGRSPSGTFNATIKSGTNQIHGSAYEQLRNEAVSATSPFMTSKPENRGNNWGGSVGGPIIENRTFYFVALEKQGFNFNPAASSTEPGKGYQTLAKALLAKYNVSVNPVTSKLLTDLWPSAALAVAAASTNNFFTPDNETGLSWNGLIKIDHSFNAKNTLSARWYAGEGPQTGPSGSYLKDYYQVAPMHVQNYSAVYNRIISSSITNQLQAGASSFEQTFNDFKHDQDVAAAGLVTGSAFLGAPSISVGSFDSIGVTQPSGRNAITAHLTDALSWVKGKHEFRFGGEFRRVQTDVFYFSNARGSLDFNGSVGPWSSDSALSDGTAIDSYSRSLADFLAGYSDQSSIAYGNSERNVYQHTWSLFAQDSWRFTQKLTLNLGLRYEHEGTYNNGEGNLSSFIPSLGGVVFQGSGISSLYPSDNGNIAPRLGFSFQPSVNSGFVVRGGGGIYYDTPSLDNFMHTHPGNGAASGIQNNPGGTDSVSSVSQQVKTIVSGQSFYANAASSATFGLYTISQSFRTPHSYNYYLQLEKSFGLNVLAKVGYVGTQGRNQEGLIDINPSALNSSTGAVVQSSRPYYSKYPTYAAINQLTSGFSSNYNSLQAILQLKSWHGLQAEANYTLGRNLDTLSDVGLPLSNSDIALNYGNSDNDIRQTVVGFVSYPIPEYKSSNIFLRGLTSGWSLTIGFNFHGGSPFTITNSSDTTGTGDHTQRVDVVGKSFAGVSHKLSSSQITWINTSAFAAPAAGTYGNERRNQYYGPGYEDIDLSVSRSIAITERVKGNIRAEINNVNNHLNLASPSTTFNSGGSYGLVTGTIGSGGAPGIAAGEPINAQFQFRLTF